MFVFLAKVEIHSNLSTGENNPNTYNAIDIRVTAFFHQTIEYTAE